MKEKQEKDNIAWHEFFQNVLDEYLSFMSGKIIKLPGREFKKYFQADYHCIVEGDIPNLPPMIRPFDHLQKVNIIEYKSLHEPLNERVFREYTSRAMYIESSDRNNDYREKTTLTIFITRKPDLIDNQKYRIKQINDWKYESKWIPDLPIYILVQKGMRDKKLGEALALLQVFEGEKERQLETWNNVLSQELPNINFLKKLMEKINKEAYMNFVEQMKVEGRIEGILKVLSWTDPCIVEKYEADIKAAKTEKELERVEENIKKEIKKQKS